MNQILQHTRWAKQNNSTEILFLDICQWKLEQMSLCCFSKLQHNLTFPLRMHDSHSNFHSLASNSHWFVSKIRVRLLQLNFLYTGNRNWFNVCRTMETGDRSQITLITTDLFWKTFYMPHIQHAVSVCSCSSIEFHWKDFRLWLHFSNFCVLLLSGREVTKYS